MMETYKGTPYGDSHRAPLPAAIPGRVYCAYYDAGGEGVAYHDADPENHGSGELNPVDGSYLHSFRIDEGVDTSYVKYRDNIDLHEFNRTTPEENMLYVGWTEPGEWLNYTVDVAESGCYAVHFLCTCKMGGSVSLGVDGKDATGPLAIPALSHPEEPIDWRQVHHWALFENLAQVHLEKGRHVLTLHTLENGNMNYGYLAFVRL